MRNLLLAAAVLAGASLAGWQPAVASSTGWYQVEGGSVRLITTGLPDAEGKLRGVLDINLNPGWKTYWRDPGDAGVPPQVDVSKSSAFKSAEIDFPVPQRHDDGYSKWAGYDYPVSLPVTFMLKQPDQSGSLEADVFLGICQTICIPVQTSFTLDPDSDPDNFEDQAAVEAAFKALPAPATPEFGIDKVSGNSHELVVEAKLPAGATDADLYLAGDDAYQLGAPERQEAGGKLLFKVPVLSVPAAVRMEGGLHYTLVAGDKAVSGILPYF